MAYSMVSEALQKYVRAVSHLDLNLKTSLYQRHNLKMSKTNIIT